jgi:hypothetical protein
LEIAPAIAAPQRLFFGEGRRISIAFHNPESHPVSTEIRTRTYQASSSTAALLHDNAWKTLEVLPGQTIVESTPLDFPAVRAETTFIVQWLEPSGRVIGREEVLVYPSSLLAELKPMADGTPIGLMDPRNHLKPLLAGAHVEFEDFDKIGCEDFSGRLAIIGPFESAGQMPEDLPRRIKTMAARGVAVVWIQPPSADSDELRPSFYPVSVKHSTVMVAQAGLVADLEGDPQSQLNLTSLCRLALHPKKFALPELACSLTNE